MKKLRSPGQTNKGIQSLMADGFYYPKMHRKPVKRSLIDKRKFATASNDSEMGLLSYAAGMKSINLTGEGITTFPALTFPGHLKFFQDLLIPAPGDKWADMIYQYIDASGVFFSPGQRQPANRNEFIKKFNTR